MRGSFRTQAFEHGAETVDLNNKEIGDEGGAEVAALLATSTTVKKLTMSYCKLTAKTTAALADAMIKNKSLVELVLRCE